ncbi:MAG: disulfide bond formation protein B [Lysobacteraceae bacterium SCN 69-48]|nr:MAG: disulfide bond formation protein B [Xanthomonadaceae bacterium SCN 69-48]
MNPFRWSFRQQFLFGFVICAALLGYALFVQFKMGIEPCPFCIFQRICFAALGLVFLLGALHAPRAPGGRKAWGVLAFVAAAAGMGVAGRHSWVQLFPPELPTCTPGWNFLVEQNSWLGVMRKVLLANGDCSSIDWQFLGLSMPMWALLWFVALGLGALYAGFQRRHAHRFRR